MILQHAVLTWRWHEQVPSNVGIYSKLLGQHHMSVFMSMLQLL